MIYSIRKRTAMHVKLSIYIQLIVSWERECDWDKQRKKESSEKAEKAKRAGLGPNDEVREEY